MHAQASTQQSKKRLALAILDFLQTSQTDGSVAPDDAEQLEVAANCIAEAFKVDAADEAAKKDAEEQKKAEEAAAKQDAEDQKKADEEAKKAAEEEQKKADEEAKAQAEQDKKAAEEQKKAEA